MVSGTVMLTGPSAVCTLEIVNVPLLSV